VCACIYSEHIKLPAKLLDYFLKSNKSNINQCVQTISCPGHISAKLAGRLSNSLANAFSCACFVTQDNLL